jgi:hypothetical protein
VSAPKHDDSIPLTISVRINVALSVYAQRDEGGDVQITSVRSIVGLPDPREVIEALDADGDLEQLDKAFEEAQPTTGEKA